MTNYSLLSRILLGIKRHPAKFIILSLAVYATIWIIIEPLVSIVPDTSAFLSGWPKYFVLIFISLVIGSFRIASPPVIILKNNNSIIKIKFGDLFSQDGFKVIPVSRFFFETNVIETSLQNIVIRKHMESEEGIIGIEKYRTNLFEALKNIEYEEICRSETERNERFYPLGTTAYIKLKEDLFLLFSVTQTELKGYIPPNNCNVTNMWIALEKFWSEARVHARGHSVNIPLLGSGITGINLSPMRILELNLLSILNSIVEGGKITTSEIRIILHSNLFEDIDLSKVAALWK